MMKQANAKQEEGFAVAQTQPKNKGGRPKLGTHMAAMEFNVYDKDFATLLPLSAQRWRTSAVSRSACPKRYELRCVNGRSAA